METIRVNRDKILERQAQCMDGIKYYELAFRDARQNKNEFYMNSYLRKINRFQAEFDALQWVLEKCETKEEENNL